MEKKESEKGMWYRWYCLSMLILFEIFTQWGRCIIAIVNGFGVVGLRDKPYYNIKLDVEGFTKNMYGVIAGPAYTITLAVCLLFTG